MSLYGGKKVNQSSSKTIVQINVTCNGSTGRIMNMIQQTANRAGYRSISVFGRGKPPSQGEFIKIGNLINMDWVLERLLKSLFPN
jgi:FlaG/FlaF family flagellin (archaellin)